VISPAREALERVLGHSFRDPALLDLALTHPSRSWEEDGSRGNERLEFLGDAVLDLAVAHALFDAHPDWPEGELTRARSALVSSPALARCARRLGLGQHVRLGRSEQRTGGERKSSVLANALEAVVGAVYLDGGFGAACAAVRRLFGEALEGGAPPVPRDPKTRFQEWAHAGFRVTPVYRAEADSGEVEDPERFTVGVWVGEERWGRGRGRTKREAERAAARDALERAGAPEDVEGGATAGSAGA